MKRKYYFTRKNLIVLALALFYAISILVTGVCIEGTHSIVSKRNMINKIAEVLKFPNIEPSIAGYIGLLLVAIYVALFVAAVLYIRRYAIENKIKPYHWKPILAYVGAFLVCLVLSVGLTLLLVSPKNGENILNTLNFLWHSFALGSLIFLFGGIAITAVVMLVVNFIFIDKPFRFFDQNKMDVVEEEEFEHVDVSNSFDPIADADMNGYGFGAGAGAGGVGGVGAGVAGEGGAGGSASGSGAGGFGGSFGGGAGGAGSSADGSGSSSLGMGGLGMHTTEELGDREKVFPALSAMDIHFRYTVCPPRPTADISLEELCVKFRNYLAKEESLYFDMETIRIFISAFAASQFMILEGLSGTGKSSLPRYFSKFVNGKLLFTPVQATWRDKSSILGFFNEFSKTYTETDFLIQLYHANYDPDRIHIFVLDEMNISRVEYYFADLLSVLEYPKSEWKLRLMQIPYGFVPPEQIADGNVQIMPNCYFVGTANKDDSTFSIADKVYDRAITLDFDYRNKPFKVTEETPTISLSSSKLQALYEEAIANEENQLTDEDRAKLDQLSSFVYEQFDVAFGNRIMNQIEKLVPTLIACGGTKEEALDFVFARKVLVKLEGRFEEYVKGALNQLLQLLHQIYGPGVFKHSEKEIRNLIRKL